MNKKTKKQLTRTLQTLCIGTGLLCAGVAPTALAATITNTRQYNNLPAFTCNDDFNIANGFISTTSKNSTVFNFTGASIYINQEDKSDEAYALLATSTHPGCDATSYLNINSYLAYDPIRGKPTYDKDGKPTYTDGDATVQIIGNVQTNRGVGQSGEGGSIHLSLTNENSYLAGKLILKSGSIYLRLSNGATWYVPENDNTYDLLNISINASDNGYIDLYHTLPGVARSLDAGKRTFIGNTSYFKYGERVDLNGATFVLSSDIKNNLSDKVALTQVADGVNNYNLQIVYDPSMNVDGTYTAGSAPIIFTTDNTDDTVTAKTYTMTRTNDAGLRAANITVTPTLSTNGGVTKLTALNVRNFDTDGPAALMAGAAATAQLGALSAWRAENNDLQRRLGDLRWDEGTAGAWARAYGGESEIHSDVGSDVSYRGIQVGYDRARSYGDGKLFTGIALSTMKGDASGSAGNSETQSKLFGVYGSYMGRSGHFVDAIVKYGRLSNNTTRTYDAERYTGDYAANGLNMSLEYGYSKELRNGFYLEPQVELTYSHINSSSYTMTANGGSGAYVQNNGMDSLISRIGITAGRKTEGGNVYLKLSGLHEFKGDTGMTATYSGTTISRATSGSDTWMEYGVGFNQRMANSQNLYGEITRTAFANKMSEKWKANLGFRTSF